MAGAEGGELGVLVEIIEIKNVKRALFDKLILLLTSLAITMPFYLVATDVSLDAPEVIGCYLENSR